MIGAKDFGATFARKSVLVTGHTGFKGSWLCAMLHEMGSLLHGFSIDEPEDPRHSYYALGIKSLLVDSNSAIGDVRDMSQFSAKLESVQPDFIFHLAAQPIVSTSYRDPYLTFSTNILGILNLLEILRARSYPTTCIIITSDKCYKNKERAAPYLETDEMGGDDPYSASKGAAELVFHSYNVSFPDLGAKFGIATVRAGNVFGGGDWSRNRLIPDCARELFAGGKVEIRMPKAVRPWTFVVDILFGYLCLAANLRAAPDFFRGSWNFASGETKTVVEMVEIFIDQLQFGHLEISANNAFGKEAGLLLIDATKARRLLNWDCKLPVEKALRHTADWYRLQHQGGDVRAFSQEFLIRYFLNQEATCAC
jgi:CDP-glucose 4,6-dehydratase